MTPAPYDFEKDPDAMIDLGDEVTRLQNFAAALSDRLILAEDALDAAFIWLTTDRTDEVSQKRFTKALARWKVLSNANR